MNNRNIEIANEILRQLGGRNKLTMMIGMKDAFAIENGLVFKFKMSKVANYVSIVLNGNDLYDITFKSLRGLNQKDVEMLEDVYYDDLKRIFENTTKLYLSL